jgi:hypothetical protein
MAMTCIVVDTTMTGMDRVSVVVVNHCMEINSRPARPLTPEAWLLGLNDYGSPTQKQICKSNDGVKQAAPRVIYPYLENVNKQGL